MNESQGGCVSDVNVKDADCNLEVHLTPGTLGVCVNTNVEKSCFGNRDVETDDRGRDQFMRAGRWLYGVSRTWFRRRWCCGVVLSFTCFNTTTVIPIISSISGGTEN